MTLDTTKKSGHSARSSSPPLLLVEVKSAPSVGAENARRTQALSEGASNDTTGASKHDATLRGSTPSQLRERPAQLNDATRQKPSTHSNAAALALARMKSPAAAAEEIERQRIENREWATLRLLRHTADFARIVHLARLAHSGADAEWLAKVEAGLGRVVAFCRARTVVP